jgi:hypothetical protein
VMLRLVVVATWGWMLVDGKFEADLVRPFIAPRT